MGQVKGGGGPHPILHRRVRSKEALRPRPTDTHAVEWDSDPPHSSVGRGAVAVGPLHRCELGQVRTPHSSVGGVGYGVGVGVGVGVDSSLRGGVRAARMIDPTSAIAPKANHWIA